MSKELVIGSNRHETKVAVLEDDQLVEVYFQRGDEYSLAGSVHKGRVTRVLPGMQSAFVDLGLERDTFLYVTDFLDEQEDIDAVADDKSVRVDRREPFRGRAPELAAAVPPRDEGQRPDFASAVPSEEIAPPREGTVEAREPELEAPPSLERRFTETVSTAPAPISPDVRGADLPARPPADRIENDRGFRGDRRGRRSRRRRPRQGFPENKYAQPVGAVGTEDRQEPRPELQRSPERVADVEVETDVIVLPGESLAKYRQMTSGGETSAERPVISETNETLAEQDLPADVDAPSDEEVQEEIEAEREELELADKVLSHHDDPSPIAVEEKLEEVKQDQPAPSSESSAFETLEFQQERQPEVNPEVESYVAFVEERVTFPDPSFEATNAAGTNEFLDDDDEPESAGVEEDETELRSSSIPEAGAISAEEPRQTSGEESRAAGEPAGPQTAMLRDQGGRYMHRMSRRMRRRRGGNRFENPVQEIGARGEASARTATPIITADQALRGEARSETRSTSEEERAANRPDRTIPLISDLLKPGQEIIVQIAKEPLGQKGARITSHVALPGRYVVFMPSVSHGGVSRKIASEEERHRLKRILQTHRAGNSGGFIVRTAGEGVPEAEIAADMNYLYKLWNDIREKAEKKPAPALLHYDLDVVQRILRDRLTEDFKAIWVDNEDLYENVLSFMQRFQPSLVSRVKMYTRSAPIFDAFNITPELEKALRPKVWLKSGGYIVINQTEALVAIDINTGKFVGKSNRLEDTIVKTNTEAVKEIVRQIRLRDLGGIIVVDFIDMDERRNRQKVMQTLEEAMRADRAPYKILQFNDFGLVAITRKRVKQSLERTLCSPCPYCEGAGYIKSVQTVISEILVEAQKLAKSIEGKDAVLRVNPAVAKVLKASSNRYLEEIEDILGCPVLVTSDATLHVEKFDLA